MPIIDVFIALKMYTEVTNPQTGQTEKKQERTSGGTEKDHIYKVPNWKELQKYASEKGSVLNVYTEDDGSCNMRNFLKSLQSRLRIIIIAAHGWTDGRELRNGTIEAGGGIRINQGQAIGTFGVTQAKTDKRGRVYGEYSPIPIIQASRLFFFSCNPGGDFREILRTHLIRGSIA